ADLPGEDDPHAFDEPSHAFDDGAPFAGGHPFDDPNEFDEPDDFDAPPSSRVSLPPLAPPRSYATTPPGPLPPPAPGPCAAAPLPGIARTTPPPLRRSVPHLPLIDMNPDTGFDDLDPFGPPVPIVPVDESSPPGWERGSIDEEEDDE